MATPREKISLTSTKEQPNRMLMILKELEEKFPLQFYFLLELGSRYPQLPLSNGSEIIKIFKERAPQEQFPSSWVTFNNFLMSDHWSLKKSILIELENLGLKKVGDLLPIWRAHLNYIETPVFLPLKSNEEWISNTPKNPQAFFSTDPEVVTTNVDSQGFNFQAREKGLSEVYILDQRESDHILFHYLITVDTPKVEDYKKEVDQKLARIHLLQRLRKTDKQKVRQQILSHPYQAKHLVEALSVLDQEPTPQNIHVFLSLPGLDFTLKTCLILSIPFQYKEQLLATLEELGTDALRDNEVFTHYGNPYSLLKHSFMKVEDLILDHDLVTSAIRDFYFRVNPGLREYWWIPERNKLLKQPLSKPSYEYYVQSDSTPYLKFLAQDIPKGNYIVRYDSAAWAAEGLDPVEEELISVDGNLDLYFSLKHPEAEGSPLAAGTIYIELLGDGHSFFEKFQLLSVYQRMNNKKNGTHEISEKERTKILPVVRIV